MSSIFAISSAMICTQTSGALKQPWQFTIGTKTAIKHSVQVLSAHVGRRQGQWISQEGLISLSSSFSWSTYRRARHLDQAHGRTERMVQLQNVLLQGSPTPGSDRAGHQVENMGIQRVDESFESWPSSSVGRRKAIRFPRRGSQISRWVQPSENFSYRKHWFAETQSLTINSRLQPWSLNCGRSWTNTPPLPSTRLSWSRNTTEVRIEAMETANGSPHQSSMRTWKRKQIESIQPNSCIQKKRRPRRKRPQTTPSPAIRPQQASGENHQMIKVNRPWQPRGTAISWRSQRERGRKTLGGEICKEGTGGRDWRRGGGRRKKGEKREGRRRGEERRRSDGRKRNGRLRRKGKRRFGRNENLQGEMPRLGLSWIHRERKMCEGELETQVELEVLHFRFLFIWNWPLWGSCMHICADFHDRCKSGQSEDLSHHIGPCQTS